MSIKSIECACYRTSQHCIGNSMFNTCPEDCSAAAIAWISFCVSQSNIFRIVDFPHSLYHKSIRDSSPKKQNVVLPNLCGVFFFFCRTQKIIWSMLVTIFFVTNYINWIDKKTIRHFSEYSQIILFYLCSSTEENKSYRFRLEWVKIWVKG